MLNFIKNSVNHFILIVFLYSTLYCYQKLYTIFSLFMRMGFIWWSAPPSEQIGYLIFHSCLDTQHTPISCLFGHAFIFHRKLDHTTLVGTLRRREIDTRPCDVSIRLSKWRHDSDSNRSNNANASPVRL